MPRSRLQQPHHESFLFSTNTQPTTVYLLYHHQSGQTPKAHKYVIHQASQIIHFFFLLKQRHLNLTQFELIRSQNAASCAKKYETLRRYYQYPGASCPCVQFFPSVVIYASHKKFFIAFFFSNAISCINNIASPAIKYAWKCKNLHLFSSTKHQRLLEYLHWRHTFTGCES